MYKIEGIKNTILYGDALSELRKIPDESIDCIVTSPPYHGLRDYGVSGQIGLEKSLGEYLDKILSVTAECKRVLKKTGTMWWNHGDSYASIGKIGGDIDLDEVMDINRGRGRIQKGNYPEKCLLLQAHRLAIRMIDDDSDDYYELRTDLTNEHRLAILEEVNKYGQEKITTIQNKMGAAMGKRESRKEKSEMETLS